MATNVYIEDDDAVAEVKRRSLLDAIEDRNKRLKKVIFFVDSMYQKVCHNGPTP